jgi:hypothetical protein
MSASDSPLKHNPFEALGMLLNKKGAFCPVPLKKPIMSTQKQVSEPAACPLTKNNEESAFREARDGVLPETGCPPI